MAGSWGTLAVVTDVTFKVLPAAETQTTLAIRGLTDEHAVAAMALALGSSAEVSGAAHLPYGVTQRVASDMRGDDAATLLRVEGFGPSVDYRIETLKRLLENAGPVDGNRRPLFKAAVARHPRLRALRRRHRASGLAGFHGAVGSPQDGAGAAHADRRRRLSTTGRAGWSGCAWRPSRKPKSCAS